MKKLTSIILILSLCAASLVGCASESSDSSKKKNKHKKPKETTIAEVEDETKETDEPTDTDVTQNQQDVSEPEASAEESVDETVEETIELTSPATSESYQVSNNFEYFVEVDNRVYFRVYGDAAFYNPVVFGNFEYYPTGNLSSIYYYDKSTGELVRAFDDWGFGNIVFYNGIFYMNGFEKAPNGDVAEIVYAVDMDGNKVDSFPTVYGEIVGNNDACHEFYVAYHNYDYETGEQTDQLLTYSDDGSLISVYDSPTHFNYIDCSPDFIFITASEYADSDDYVVALYSLTTPDSVNGYTVTKIGTFETEPMQSVTIEQYWYSDLSDLEYISVGYYEGTGHFLSKVEFYSMIPWEENSLELEKQIANEETDIYFSVIDGEIVVTDFCPDTFFLNTYNSDEDKNLMYANPYSGEVDTYYVNYVPASDYYEERYFDFYGERVDGIGFFMRAKVVFDDSASIGWRDGFRLVTMEYLLINENGELISLINVDHNVVEEDY
ncbi:MAG: hypothetical protein MJ172_06815 [Clostridia bacterium]|nr:hypothetical protein [Clostridia bacterium]